MWVEVARLQSLVERSEGTAEGNRQSRGVRSLPLVLEDSLFAVTTLSKK